MADPDFNNDIIPTNVDPKIISILAYLSLLGWVVALLLNSSAKSELASFHLRQGLGITLLRMIAGYVSLVPFLGQLSSRKKTGAGTGLILPGRVPGALSEILMFNAYF